MKIKFKNSWVYKELYSARNVKPSFNWGLIPAIFFTGIDQILFRGQIFLLLLNTLIQIMKLYFPAKNEKN